MNLILTRKSYNRWGIISELSNDAGDVLFHTLEHAYLDSSGIMYRPKLIFGAYQCVWGEHEIGKGVRIMTYEVTNVPNHTGILFHVGNYNKDSEGCILLGTALGPECVTGSRVAFDNFINMQEQQLFTLTVTI